MRAAFPPERIIEIAEEILANADSAQTRLQCLQMLADRGHGKVSDKLELKPGHADDDDHDVDLSMLSAEQLERLLALESERDAILAGVAGVLALPAAT